MPKLWNVKFTLNEIVEDPTANKVVLFTTCVADSKLGNESFSQEYVLMMDFDEAERKVKRFVEFNDCARAKELAGILFD